MGDLASKGGRPSGSRRQVLLAATLAEEVKSSERRDFEHVV